MPYVEWTPDMGEMSGMGGSYEGGCRAMVKAGVEFWEAQDALFYSSNTTPKFDPQYEPDRNDDARALDAVLEAAPITIDGIETTCGEYGTTGAMHGSAVAHIFAFRRLGAAEYCLQLRLRAQKEREEEKKSNG